MKQVVDFAIWLLFNRIHRQAYKPTHLLCHGYQRAGPARKEHEESCAVAGIPGLVSHYPNNHVSTMKNAVWAELLGLLGQEGDRIILDMILGCGIYLPLESGRDNCYQVCGVSFLSLSLSLSPCHSKQANKQASSQVVHVFPL